MTRTVENGIGNDAEPEEVTLYRRPSRRGPTSILRPFVAAAEVLRVIRWERQVQPSRNAYLGAAFAGAIVGIGLRRWLGVPWWLPAAGLPSGAWAASMTTAFTGGRAGWTIREIRHGLAWILNPEKAEEMAQREEELFRSPALPLYGLPASWQGLRFLGGWGRRGEGVNELCLGHGDPRDDSGPELRVETTRRPDVPEEYLPGYLADILADRLGRIEHEADSRPELPWEVARIPVDGEPVELRWMGEHEEWIAWAPMNGLILILHARRLPLGQVELVRITDVGPYIEGSRQLRASARLFPGT